MALVRGELSQALVVTEALMKLPADENMNWFLQSVSNLMRNLQYMETKIGQKQHFNWNANTLGPDIQLSNENLSVTRTDSSGWGC